MPTKKKRRPPITHDKIDRDALEQAIRSQGNAIPAAIAAVLRLTAPILARLAVRYVARTYRKKITDAQVNAAGSAISAIANQIIEKYSG